MNNKRFEIGAGEQPLDIIKETCGFAGIFKQIGVIKVLKLKLLLSWF